MKTVNHLGEPYYEIDENRLLKISTATEQQIAEFEKETLRTSDQLYESVAKAIDKTLESSFALFGIDAVQVKCLVEGGRLELITRGVLPEATYLAVLDNEDLFCVHTQIKHDDHTGKEALIVNIVPLKEQEV
ncbi:MAG: hypothetical protein E7554_01980 [Ruminococcaceae bacterium]|nr:hypothetical protein [Oscillospiraceae bacterium]